VVPAQDETGAETGQLPIGGIGTSIFSALFSKANYFSLKQLYPDFISAISFY